MSAKDIMGKRFGRYSKYIIQKERALPDIRIILKQCQRRILLFMKDGNTFDRGYPESAKKSVGTSPRAPLAVTHSIYDAMVRMSQDWKIVRDSR